MSDFQQKFAPGRLAEDLRRQQPPAAIPVEAEPAEVPQSASHVGADRNRKPRLELRFKDGRIRAVNYGDIVLMEYDPDAGITLDLPPHFRVRIQGVALAPLLGGLASERTAFLREVDEFAASARQDGKPVVLSISFVKWQE